ncbi:ribonuclease HIII [Metabacillus malikii]|uniref:Ribonuclease HIII n=1 Tax=Metabacillus malikii TaxID=1504265 RepID=A0ABT9ZFF6_9BACI|nr:ribonuclease HIII [Metabacillus malikii]MDQ0230984.1 ribonuclease HIII [Metabacillus malikii]
MGNSVIQVDLSTIKKMESYYAINKVTKTPQGAIFSAKISGCTLTAYKSGKVLFQGTNAEVESSRWGKTLASKAKPNLSKTPERYQPPQNIANLSIIGSDEVGTGDFFGPMTVVAAYVKSDQILLLQELGVKDSKHLKDPQIVNIAKDLIQTIPYSLLVLHNEKYNKLQQQGYSQGKMKALLHNQAINHLLKKISPERPDGILIDQFAEPAIYFKHLQGKQIGDEKFYFSTKAEGVHLAVAAASIIARYSFIKEFDRISEIAGVQIPKGAGAQVDIAAAKILRKNGREFLESITKKHFANTEKAIKLANKS